MKLEMGRFSGRFEIVEPFLSVMLGLLDQIVVQSSILIIHRNKIGVVFLHETVVFEFCFEIVQRVAFVVEYLRVRDLATSGLWQFKRTCYCSYIDVGASVRRRQRKRK